MTVDVRPRLADDPRVVTGPVISCRGLTCHAGGRTIIEDLALGLDEGERVALMGPSGSGKTTLLTTLAGLAPPAAGRVDHRPAGRAPRVRRRGGGRRPRRHSRPGDQTARPAAARRHGPGTAGPRRHLGPGAGGRRAAGRRGGGTARPGHRPGDDARRPAPAHRPPRRAAGGLAGAAVRHVPAGRQPQAGRGPARCPAPGRRRLLRVEPAPALPALCRASCAASTPSSPRWTSRRRSRRSTSP